MERAPFKCLFWNANDLIVKLMVSIERGILCDTDLAIKICQIMTTTTNAENCRITDKLSVKFL